MPAISWAHDSRALVLPIVVMGDAYSDNPFQSIHTTGLLDTGATSSGISHALVEQLGVLPRGRRRLGTANGEIVSNEYLIRVGFVCGDYRDPAFDTRTALPFVLDREIRAFELQPSVSYPVLIGMDVIGSGDLTIRRDGSAKFLIG